MFQLNHDRVATLINESKTGEDPVADRFIENPEDPLYVNAKELHESGVRRHYVEAALLATDDFEHIGNVLDMPIEVVATYAKIYYDVYGLDRLGKLTMVEKATSDDERTLKLWAISQGIDFIAWRLGKRVEISAVGGLTDLFSDCIFKSKEALFNENASLSSKESTKWVKLSIDIARLLKIWVTDSRAATKDIELALKKVVPNYTAVADVEAANRGEIQLDLLGELQQEEAELSTPPSVEDLIKGSGGSNE